MKTSTIARLALALAAPLAIHAPASAQWTTATNDVYTSSTAYEVGIGQFSGTGNTPQRLLHLWSTGANQLRLQDQNGSWDIGGGGDFHIIQNSSGNDIFNFNTLSSYIRIGPGSELYLNTSTHNVGVGTGSSPAARIEASSSSTTEPQLKATSTNNSDFARIRLSGNGNDFTLSVGSPSSSFSNIFNIYSHTANANVLSVTSGQKVGIKTTSPTVELDVNGNIRCVAITTTSDLRWKTSVATLDGALEKVMRLRGVSYEYRKEEFPGMTFPSGRQIGFIAQEVEQVVPQIVATDEKGYKSVAYQNVTALLVEATKEQQAQIVRQQSTIDALTARVAELERLVRAGVAPAGVGTSVGADGSRGVLLDQNEPNPADAATRISYYLPTGLGRAELVVNEAASGREVYRTALAGSGRNTILIDRGSLDAGSYVYSVVIDGAVAASRKMIVAR